MSTILCTVVTHVVIFSQFFFEVCVQRAIYVQYGVVERYVFVVASPSIMPCIEVTVICNIYAQCSTHITTKIYQCSTHAVCKLNCALEFKNEIRKTLT
jgi:hypothetical protein